jgi:DNA-binding transcriptional LysR family regulator
MRIEKGHAAGNELNGQTTAADLGLGRMMSKKKDFIGRASLVRVLDDWCPPRPGYHLYYPSRRQPTPAFSLVVNALRHRP